MHLDCQFNSRWIRMANYNELSITGFEDTNKAIESATEVLEQSTSS